MKKIAQLHCISDNIETIEKICKSGLDCLIQLRVKNKKFREWLAIAQEAKNICRSYDINLIINDNVLIAQKIEAYGVHLGQKDMPIVEARKILGENFVIGGTANTFAEVQNLFDNNIDYIGLGPFKFTKTKKVLSPVLGITGFENILANVLKNGITTPLIAIGGIEKTDVKNILKLGFHGVAVSSAINQWL